jgi:hypothetical protein
MTVLRLKLFGEPGENFVELHPSAIQRVSFERANSDVEFIEPHRPIVKPSRYITKVHTLEHKFWIDDLHEPTMVSLRALADKMTEKKV